MLRPSAPTLLLSVLGLSLASFTFACSGASSRNDDVDSSKLAVQQQKDGKPTGNGKTCSWSGWGDLPTVTPPVEATPPSGGSSGGCDTAKDGITHCWSYDAEGRQVDITPSGSGSSTSSSSSSGWTGSSSSSGSTGSSGGCVTDGQGNSQCWSDPPEPTPEPTPTPTPIPAPVVDTYQVGDWFPSLDGCNKCTCTDIGIMCTVQVCAAPPPPPVKGCEVSGKWIASGANYYDGCNTCSCGPDGFVACTERACQDAVPPTPKK